MPAAPSPSAQWQQQFEAFAALTANLHRLRDVGATEHLQHMALQAVVKALHCDSALWAVGSIVAGEPRPQGIALINQPPEMMQAWERIKHLDTVFASTVSRPGVAILATAAGVVDGVPSCAEIQAHAQRYGMEHIIAVLFVDPLTQLFTAVSLYRKDPERAFTEPERVMAQSIFPVMGEIWSQARIAAVSSQLGNDRWKACALADAQGVLHAVAPEFSSLLKQAFPTWTGPGLPQELLKRDGERRLSGGVYGRSRGHGTLWLHELRDSGKLDALGERERQVAQMLAAGQTFRKIAQDLRLSPDTVRNHIRHVYAKTGVHNKVELVRLMSEAGQANGDPR